MHFNKKRALTLTATSIQGQKATVNGARLQSTCVLNLHLFHKIWKSVTKANAFEFVPQRRQFKTLRFNGRKKQFKISTQLQRCCKVSLRTQNSLRHQCSSSVICYYYKGNLTHLFLYSTAETIPVQQRPWIGYSEQANRRVHCQTFSTAKIQHDALH